MDSSSSSSVGSESWRALVGSLGVEIGVRLSEPNWASRNMKRRSRRSVGERLACGFRVGRSWEWVCECLLEDSDE